MSNLDKLIALGAQPVGGDLIWKHKVLGKFHNGEFAISADGVAALDVEDVEVKTITPKPAKAAKAKKVELPEPDTAEPAPATGLTTAGMASIEDLLGD